MQLRHRTAAQGCYRLMLGIVILTSAAHAELDKQAVRRTVKRHLRDVVGCFERHGQSDKQVKIDFVIAPAGRVTSATAHGEGDKPLQDCLVGVFKRITFPTARNATKVTYPVHIITAGP